ncbi:dihydrofolate reductase, partial [Acinetobacter baumannii]
IGKPLPGRKNIILTHDTRFQASGCEIVFSIEEALHAAQPCEEVMIIGGSSLYQQMLERAQTIYLTKINKIFTADTFFPEWDEQEWVEESC